MSMSRWFKLFWMFFKINLLTTSGPASVGLLYKEAVGDLMDEKQFIEAVGFSSVLPGSDALQLAMFAGYSAGGVSGALAALLGSIIPPTVLMLGLVTVLESLSKASWMEGFVRGLSPAVAMLMVVVAWQVFRGESGKQISWRILVIGGLSLAGYLLGFSPPLVLLGAGVMGVILLR